MTFYIFITDSLHSSQGTLVPIYSKRNSKNLQLFLTPRWSLVHPEFLQLLQSKIVHAKDKMQFIFICWTVLLLFSKHLEFLSFQTVHQMDAGIILHLSPSPVSLPASSQLAKGDAMLSGIIQAIPPRAQKILHTCPVTLQWRKRCFNVSAVSPHEQHLGHMVIPLFIIFSLVRQLLWLESQTKLDT